MISRSGACTVSELCLAAKPAIFVPSPNVAEDHQTKNAQALVSQGAALLVPDAAAVGRAMDEAVAVLADGERLKALSAAIEKLATPRAAEAVADEILEIIG